MKQFKLILSLLFVVLAMQQLFAQTNGRISGVVVDGNNGDAIIGANVYLEGTSLGASTDMEGNYVILNVPAGKYELVVMMVGFAEVRIKDTHVGVNKLTRLDITLTPEVLEGDVVVVEAKSIKNTDASLLKQRQKAIAVSDAVSYESMSRSGSSNVAEAMKQVTGASLVDGKYVYVRGLGDRYTNTQLNGAELPSTDPYKRSGAVDMIPTNLIDNIVTVKSFTPDRPGNFSGGAVDINTKDFPDALNISFSSSASYNSQSTFKNTLSYDGGGSDWLGYDDGTRALSGLLSANEAFIPSPNTKDADEFNLLRKQTSSFSKQMVPGTSSFGLNQSYSLSVGNQFMLFGKPFGFITSLTYNNKNSAYSDGERNEWNLAPASDTPFQSVYKYSDSKATQEVLWGTMVKGSLRLTPTHTLSVNGLYNQNGESTSRQLQGYWDDFGDARLTTSLLSYTERNLKSIQFRGDHYFSSFLDSKIGWKASFGTSTQDEPDRRVFAYGYNANKDQYVVKTNTVPARYFRNLSEDRNTFTLDWEIPFKQWEGLGAKWKMGGLYSEKRRDYNERLFKLDGQPNINFNGNLDSLFSAENYWGNIDTSYITIRGQQYPKYSYSGLFVRETILPKNRYSAGRDIAAAYAMLELPLTQNLRFIGGARLETTDMFVETGTKDTGNSNDYVKAKIDDTDILPSINFVYNMYENMNIRVAFSNTLARPTFREFAPFYTEDFIGGAVYSGNSALKKTLINNYDMRWEWYSRPGEIMAVSLFHKRFKNPIEPVLLGQNRERSWVNVDQALITGVEFEVNSKLDRLHDLLSNFSFGGNLSLVDSKVDIDAETLADIRLKRPDAESVRPFQGQSPILVNLNLNYDNLENGLSATLYYNVFGTRLSEVARNGAPNIYEKPFNLLNFSLNWQVLEQWNVKFSASNILDSSMEKIQTYKSIDYRQSYYKKGRDFKIGLGYKL